MCVRGNQTLRRLDHRRDDAFGVAGAAPPDMLGVLARRDERRHRIDVRRQRDAKTVAPLREHVEAARLHFHALHAAAETLRQRRQAIVEIVADPLFVIRDRFDIDQRARELEYVHIKM